MVPFCSSVFVSSTLSEPDVAEMLSCVSLLLHHQMQEDREVPPDPSIPPPAYDFSEDDSVSNPDELPKLSDFNSFLKKTYKIAKWSPECHIMALVFVNRLTGYTSIRLHNSNWRPILLCSLLLAQKVCGGGSGGVCVCLGKRGLHVGACDEPLLCVAACGSCGTTRALQTLTSLSFGGRRCRRAATAKLGESTA